MNLILTKENEYWNLHLKVSIMRLENITIIFQNPLGILVVCLHLRIPKNRTHIIEMSTCIHPLFIIVWFGFLIFFYRHRVLTRSEIQQASSQEPKTSIPHLQVIWWRREWEVDDRQIHGLHDQHEVVNRASLDLWRRKLLELIIEHGR